MACAAPDVLSKAVCRSPRSPPRALTTSSWDVPASAASRSASAKASALPPEDLRMSENAFSLIPSLPRLPCMAVRSIPTSDSESDRLPMLTQAPSMAMPSSSKRSALVPSMAFTDFRSTLLNISLSAWVCSSCVSEERAPFRSPKVSFSGRRLPSASNAFTPNASSWAAALSVGADRDRIMLRRAVPPSAPLMPLSARTPRAILSSVVPPDRFFAVPPTVRIASPSCWTLVLDLELAAAILSTRSAVSPIDSPSADWASVTMSDAEARSMPPAAARFSTFGSMVMDFSAS